MQNFAGRLLERLGRSSCLVDAASGETLTAADIPEALAGYAHAFSRAGLHVGDRVMIGCDQHLASGMAYLGAMYGGFVPVPVHERALETWGEAIHRRSGARILWTAQDVECSWIAREGLPHLRGSPAPHARSLPAERGADDPAALMPTSGSTGAPRLVEVTHGNLTANTEAIIRSQGLAADDRAMLILPVSYCFGASVLHTHLYQGGSVVFDSRFMFPDRVLTAIARLECTTFAGVPTVYGILLRRSNIRTIAMPSLRRFLQAGGALAPGDVQQLRKIAPHADFHVMYGQTEATSRIASMPPQRLNEKAGSVGLPLDNLQIRIVDERGLESAACQPGEIQVCGSSVCRGYFGDCAATREKFRDGWLLTGDVGFREAEGFLWIVGRKSEFIKMRGVRVSFAEIESRLAARAAGAVECAVAAVPHAEAGEALALYVVADEDRRREVAAVIRRAMPPEWICDRVNFVTMLPRNPNGKLERSRLGQLSPVEVIEWPSSATLRAIGLPQAAARDRPE